MLKPDLQHQFWVTKKAVQRKLGTKEDECIVSSDAELDSKIDLLKSIGDSCSHLKRILDNYQEKICILAQEENALGVFLKESSKHSTTTSKAMSCAGKSISFCGQQHMKIRTPLVRLHHEVETFNGQAIKDTYNTVQAMERERTEYRAALGWMKAASAQLDPDKGRGLDKFRNAQMYVRTAKTKFDTMTLDCLQKIDLLAAARCNMFSHVLAAYQTALIDFATKTSYTFQAALKILEEKPQYNFTILKDLTQVPVVCDTNQTESKEITPIDFDQMLFFKEDFEDEVKSSEKDSSAEKPVKKTAEEPTTSKSEASISATSEMKPTVDDSTIFDLLDLSTTEPTETDCLLDIFNSAANSCKPTPATAQSSSNILMFDFLKKIPGSTSATSATMEANSSKKGAISKPKMNDKKTSAWMDLFADLDPLANPTNMEKKIAGLNQNCLDA
ncbi:islet cell autoantigen 1 [Sitodiplosis mosellana]|uniref:islet cell autoantigen 1 n=1 Tax=Sitodiplosis mosellana TaxID=263140 RepID=UPI002444C1CB|nr:islet cell autoantigen 1 [Sitodiplosis mosellana]XP_055315828.1 islet cell autoantigen 1 [Sitodiplosis mosellana]